ncbi:MAG: hypothetical protein NZL93_01250, partial [Chthoniobacterales bacterium]|nr:hypothetical protein [Chthoniobacterales bacterium]
AFSSMNTEDVFRKLEEYLSNILSVLINILGSGGPIELSFSELVAELGSLNGGTFFATSFAQGPNRAFDVVKRLKKCPFFRVGLEDTPIRRAVVHLQGGADLKMNEVAIVFEELQKEFTECFSFKVGISTKGIPEGSLRLTVFGSKKEISTPIAKTVIQTQLNSQDVASLQKTKKVDSFEPQSDQIGYKLMKEEVQQTNFSRQSLFIEGRENLLANGNKGEVHFERNIKMVQSELPLVGEESMSKFCFTEPTLEEGENLDVPTYIRWNIKIR